MKRAPIWAEDYPIYRMRPRWLTRHSAWHEHIPWAFLLVDALRPARIVELGTHAGDSYCAFTQAVKSLNIDCECHAVDHWQGDEQAGYYGPEILKALRKHHDPRYDQFSTLHEMDFAQARRLFEDESIDILHIDGSHGYEEVKADYESWWPKVRSGGIVLLHDTKVQRPGFGVWRLWETIQNTQTTLSFDHGHGLGLVFKGGPGDHSLRHLMQLTPADWAAGGKRLAKQGRVVAGVAGYGPLMRALAFKRRTRQVTAGIDQRRSHVS